MTDDITDFPDTMPPSPHTHSIDDITDYTPEEPPELTEGTTNGTVNYDGVDVPVHGLGSAAYTETSDYISYQTFYNHVDDSNNPHNVTAAQAGAEPVRTMYTRNISTTGSPTDPDPGVITLSVVGVTTNSDVFIQPVSETDYQKYVTAGISWTAQSEDSLTYTYKRQVSGQIAVRIIIFNGQ